MRSLDLEVEDKSAKPVLQKGLVKVSNRLKATFLPLSSSAAPDLCDNPRRKELCDRKNVEKNECTSVFLDSLFQL
jgi:hypothetical protein